MSTMVMLQIYQRRMSNRAVKTNNSLINQILT